MEDSEKHHFAAQRPVIPLFSQLSRDRDEEEEEGLPVGHEDNHLHRRELHYGLVLVEQRVRRKVEEKEDVERSTSTAVEGRLELCRSASAAVEGRLELCRRW